MTTPTTQTPKSDAKAAAKPANETAPEPLDDAVENDGGEEGDSVERERLASEEQHPKSVRPEFYRDEARDRIARLYREKRDMEERGETAQPEGEEGEPAAAAPEAEAQDGAAAAQPAPSADGQQRVKIVVDGKEELLPLDEVVRRAQINTATDNRLEEAKRLLREAKDVRAAPANQPAAASPQQGAQAPISQPDPPAQAAQHQGAQAKALDPEMLGSIIERIQVGDKDEGAQALLEFANAVKQSEPARQGVDANEVGRIVAQQLVHTQTEAGMREALDRFKEKYPQIAVDHDLGVTGLGILARHLVEELKAQGLTEEQLAPYKTDVRQMAHATAMYRRAGRNAKSFDELLDATGKVMEQKYGLKQATSDDPPPARETTRQPQNPPAGTRIATEAEIRQRQERKRSMPSQPRPAGVRQPAPQPPRPKTAADIIAETRRARGFN